MQQWEYRIWQYEMGSGVENIQKEWDALGRDGWEYVCERTSFYIFKRPRKRRPESDLIDAMERTTATLKKLYD